MLSTEEKHTKLDILEVTEEVLQVHGIEWDSKISKISQEELKEILGDIRKLRKRKGKAMEKPDENELPELESTKEPLN